MTEGIRLKPHTETGNRTAVAVFWAVIAMCAVVIVSVCVNIALADNLWDQINTILKQVYGYILIISTMVGVVAAAICLIIKMMSKSQRACEESSAWLKRIAIAWIALNMLGLIATWATGLVANNNGWTNVGTAITNSKRAADQTG